MASNTTVKKAAKSGKSDADNKVIKNFVVTPPLIRMDSVTIFGLSIALALIFIALFLGGSPKAFFNIPALFIVVGGTMAVSAVSCTSDELSKLGMTLKSTLKQIVHDPQQVAIALLQMAIIARTQGLLALSKVEGQLEKDPELMRGAQFVIDGFDASKIQNVLQNELDAMIERSRRSAAIIRRASEVAPAMGLIGTLVGLVQMLSQLDNPDSIGPAMAIALLTTFYGALLGTVILGPLAGKIERNANQQALIKSLILTGMIGIATQENTRQLEIQFNAMLPSDQQIAYFS